MEVPNDLLTPRQDAQIAKVAGSTVYENVRRGRLRGYRIAGRAVFVSRDQVEAVWLRPRRRDRYRKGHLPLAIRLLGAKKSARKPLLAALAENRRDPYRDTRECAAFASCLRAQIHYNGWESLPEEVWHEAKRIVQKHPGCSFWQVAQEQRYVRLLRGEYVGPRHFLV